jgi:hypothetical protein
VKQFTLGKGIRALGRELRGLTLAALVRADLHGSVFERHRVLGAAKAMGRPFRPGTPRLAFVKAHGLCCRFASVHVSLGFWVLLARLPLEGSERSAVPVLGRIELFGGRDPNGRLLAPLRRADHDRGGRMIGL